MIADHIATARRRVQAHTADARDWVMFIGTFATAFVAAAVLAGVWIGLMVRVGMWVAWG